MQKQDTNPLRQFPIFKGLSDWKLKLLVADTKDRTYPPGTIIVEEGAPGDEFYVLVSGKVRVSKSFSENSANADRVIVASLKPGDIFGEMSLLELKPRSAQVTADEHSRILAFTNDQFISLMLDYPTFFLEVVRILSRRMRRNEELMIQDLKIKNLKVEKLNRHLEAEIVFLKEQLEKTKTELRKHQKVEE